MSSLDAGIRKLERLVGKLAGLASVAKKLPQPIGERVRALAEKGAASGKSPGGRAWKPLKTGGTALASLRFTVQTQNGRVTIKGNVKGAPFHQKGARRFNWRLPSRSFLPKRSLPKAWREPVVEVAKSEISKCLK